MIPHDFAKLGARDVAFIGGVFVGLVIAGLVGWAVLLWIARMMVGG